MMKSLLIVSSHHHGNTQKVACVFAGVLGAPIKTPTRVCPEELQEYTIIGFGSGIYDAKHHVDLLDLADRLPAVDKKKTFIFSTCSMPNEDEAAKNHLALRKRLQSKGYVIVGEFSCKGFNTNSLLRFFGGMNKGRPDDDLRRAEEFSTNLKKNADILELVECEGPDIDPESIGD